MNRMSILLPLLLALFAVGCGPEAPVEESVGTASQAATDVPFQGQWMCNPAAEVCADVYDFNFKANTDVTIRVTSSTATIRLGAYLSNDLFGRNLLTGINADRRCSASPTSSPFDITFKAVNAGIYKLTFSRDPQGSPAGGQGTYNVRVMGNQSFTSQGLTQAHVDTRRRPQQCSFTFSATGTLNCTGNCQDVWDLGMFPGSQLTVSTQSSGRTKLRTAVFEQGVALNGRNLLTGVALDRSCKEADQSDSVRFDAVSGGNYRFAFGRDSSSFIGSNVYDAMINITLPPTFSSIVPTIFGQTADDVSTQSSGSKCGYQFSAAAGLSCPNGSCQHTLDFDSYVSTAITLSTSITGNPATRSRLALLNGGSTAFNKLNDRAADRRCSALNGTDNLVTTALTPGRQRLVIGRDGAGTGGFALVVRTSDAVLSPRGTTITNGPPFFNIATCP